jgi:hypothetical protein
MNFSNFEILQIGILIANNPMSLSISVISIETNLAWHIVLLKKPTSDSFINQLPLLNSKEEMENYIKELNESGEKFFLLHEVIPCYGDEEEMVSFLADNLLVDWQNLSSTINQQTNPPQILVFNNKPDNLPMVHEITPILLDGQEMDCITVAPQKTK